MKTTLTLDEDKQQFDAIRQQCNKIMGTLYFLANVEQSELQNIQKFPKSTNDYLTSTQPVFKSMTTQIALIKLCLLFLQMTLSCQNRIQL